MEYKVFFQESNTIIKTNEDETLLEVEIRAGLQPDAPCGGKGICGKCRRMIVRLCSGEFDINAGLPSDALQKNNLSGGDFRTEAGSVFPAGALQKNNKSGGDAKVAAGSVFSAEALQKNNNSGVKAKTEAGSVFSAEALQKKYEGKKQEVLACQYKIDSDIVVLSRKVVHSRLLDSGIKRSFELDPYVPEEYYQDIKAEKPTQALQQDSMAFCNFDGSSEDDRYEKQTKNLQQDNGVYGEPDRILRDSILKAGKHPGLFAAAFDIGTTSVVCYLLNAENGNEAAHASMLNPQCQFGADVISRAEYAMNNGADALASAIKKALNDLITDVCRQAGIERNDIYIVSIVGNTCMHHLFLKIDPRPLVIAPYEAVIKDEMTITPKEAGLDINPCGRVFILPNIAGFVGADTVGCLLSAAFDEIEENTLMIDIGTNGEIVLGNKYRRIACSTAAGPAFEGAKIECGMRGQDGAIDHVWLDEDRQVRCSVIGFPDNPENKCNKKPEPMQDNPKCLDLEPEHMNVPEKAGEYAKQDIQICDISENEQDITSDEHGNILAKPGNFTNQDIQTRIITENEQDITSAAAAEFAKNESNKEFKAAGICGSGLLDAVSVMLKLGIIDEMGHMEDTDRFFIRDGVYVSQKDIREVQLAKSAIASGIELMSEKLGIETDDIKTVMIAGAFGNYMDPLNACRIGMIPLSLKDRIKLIGNAAGEGAKIAALNKNEFVRAQKIAEATEFLELATCSNFQDAFVDNLEFPKI